MDLDLNLGLHFKLLTRAYSVSVGIDGSRREVVGFKVSPSLKLFADGVEIKEGVIQVYPRLEETLDPHLGMINFVPQHSLDDGEHCSLSVEELLEMRKEHEEKHPGTPWGFEHLLAQHSYRGWFSAEPDDFNLMKGYDQTKISAGICLNINSKHKGIRREHDLWGNLETHWDPSKDDHLSCIAYSIDMGKTEPPVEEIVVVEEKPKGPTVEERILAEMVAIRIFAFKINDKLTWVLIGILALALILFFKKG